MAEGTDLSGTAQAAEQLLDTGQAAGSEIPHAGKEEDVARIAETQGEPAQTAETQAETAAPATQAVPEAGEVYEIDGEEVTLSKADVKFLVKHGARAFLDAQERLREQMDGGTYQTPAAPEVPETPAQAQPQVPDPEAVFKKYTKTLESRLAQLEGHLEKQATAARARQYVEEAKAALKQVEFFKDSTPEDEPGLTGMILMLQNASRGTLKPAQAAKRLADMMGKHVDKKAEKWKLGKIEAAGQKVEGGGTTHPSPPKKISRQGFWNGETLSHALDYAFGKKSD